MDAVARAIAVSLCLGAVLATQRAAAREEAARPDPLRNDAQLADVCFVDSSQGWAVGDRGAIWHTTDGGRRWQLQDSTVDCRLATVFFLDAKNGWAAGGYTQPYTHVTTGIVLRTRDGGASWSLDRKLVLPAVERIRFFDPQQGWAIGRSSAFFPSGVYCTDDGGRTWSALPSAESRGWLAGDFIDPHTGALAGRASALGVVRRRGVEALPADFGLRALKQMRLAAPAGGWLVGDGGLVLKTRDLGKSWQTTEGEISAELRNQFDFQALAVRGERCWVAGTPGTRVLSSADGGRSWHIGATGQPLPIRALEFVDDANGWAVGDLGTILATHDGGRSWQTQRGGGTRAAFLGLFGRTADIPLELVARLSADDGYLGAIAILNRDAAEARESHDDPPAQAHEATVLAGADVAESAWRFPLRPADLRLSGEQMVEVWNQANDGQALEKLEAYVVARIRIWRPNVVVTSAADARSGDPLSHVINQLVLRAVERAGDPGRYSEQITAAGLQPWKVQKVYGTLPPGQTGTTNVNTAQVAPRSSRSIGELAAPARGVIADRFSAPAANLGFRLLVDHIPQDVGKRDFFSGIPLSPGGDARRALSENTNNNLDVVRRESQLRRNLQAILMQAETNESDGRLLADVGQQTRMLQPARAAEVLLQLAERYYRQGRWELAAECFDMIVERYPTHPLSGSALVWLVQYYASSEAAWRNRATQQHTVQQAIAIAPSAPPRAPGKADESLDQAAPRGSVRRAAAIAAGAEIQRGGGLTQGADDSAARLAKAAGYAKQIEQLQPALFGEPVVRFPLAVAHRGQGLPRQAERFYLALRHARPPDAWRSCAMAELWLAEPKGPPPKELYNCLRAAGKPRLDGRLDEPLWHAGDPLALHSANRDDAEWGAEVMLAYDDEFLYVAARCTRAAGLEYTRSDEPRAYDADLADQDRIELVLDVDRDFATYYRLAIDHCGRTADSCWQDKTWNPRWFVAHGGDAATWTVEAAIPLSELTGQLPKSKTTWAVGLQRTVPTIGFQSWTTPASPTVTPEGFGYVVFQ